MAVQADPEEQRERMLAWFHEHYEEPTMLPIDDDTKDIMWIHGGPVYPLEELQSEFSDRMPDELIESAAKELEAIAPEWSPIEDEADEQDE